MNYLRLFIVACMGMILFSCNDDDEKRRQETLKAEKQNDSILKIISGNWKFNVPPATPKVREEVSGWNEWQQFTNELSETPTGTIGAYKQKTKNLVNKADKLRENIPLLFDKPQVRSRIGVLITKIKSLYTYINLDVVQQDKAVKLIGEITNETISLQKQFDEIIRLKEVPKERGEEEMLRALDTLRMANPDMLPDAVKTKPSNTRNTTGTRGTITVSDVKRTRLPLKKKPLKTTN